MSRRIQIAIVLALLSVLGCSDIERRRTQTLKGLYWASSDPELIRIQKILVDATRNANEHSLARPVLLNASLYEKAITNVP